MKAPFASLLLTLFALAVSAADNRELPVSATTYTVTSSDTFDVASDGEGFAVVWRAASNDVYLTSLTLSGTHRLIPPPRLGAASYVNPTVAIGALDSGYVVAWNGGDGVYGAKISSEGAVTRPATRIVAADVTPGLISITRNGDRLLLTAHTARNFIGVMIDADLNVVTAPFEIGSGEIATDVVASPAGFAVFATKLEAEDTRFVTSMYVREVTSSASMGEWRKVTATEGYGGGISAAFNGAEYAIAQSMGGMPAGVVLTRLSPDFVLIAKTQIGSQVENPMVRDLRALGERFLISYGDPFDRSFVATIDDVGRIEDEEQIDGPALLAVASETRVLVAPVTTRVSWGVDYRGSSGYFARVTNGVDVDGSTALFLAPPAQISPAISAVSGGYVTAWIEPQPHTSENRLLVARLDLERRPLDGSGFPLDVTSTAKSNVRLTPGGGVVLATWKEGTFAEQVVVAQILNESGRALTSKQIIGRTTDINLEPRAIYDGSNFVLAWTRQLPAPTYRLEVMASRITSKGQLLDPEGRTISGQPANTFLADLATNGETILVAWRTQYWAGHHAPNYSGIAGALIDRSLHVIRRYVVEPLTIYATSTPVRVASDGEKFVVLWHRNTGTCDQTAVHSVLIDPKSAPADQRQRTVRRVAPHFMVSGTVRDLEIAWLLGSYTLTWTSGRDCAPFRDEIRALTLSVDAVPTSDERLLAIVEDGGGTFALAAGHGEAVVAYRRQTHEPEFVGSPRVFTRSVSR